MSATLNPSFLIRQNFKLADRIRIQQETIRKRDYILIGHMMSVHIEGQRDTSGFSQSKPRWMNSTQATESTKVRDAMQPFSEKQMLLWASLSLDWLSHKKAPPIAISRDQQDLLLPRGLTALPPIPDPRWVPTHSHISCAQKDGCPGCVAPRIPQHLVGCPVVGDRVRDKIKARDGHEFGIFHPVMSISVLLGGEQGGFATIRGAVQNGAHLALLLDESDPENLQGYFCGGGFQLGG
jgi:hypothetical protein